MTDEQVFETLCQRIREDIPGFSVAYKNESWVSKLLGVLVYVFNPKYMTSITTTRYPKVYFPSRKYVEENYRKAWKILAHEYVHLFDRKRWGMKFNVRYFSPQIFSLLSLSAIATVWVGKWGLLGLIPLLCLAPWPSHGRMRIEMRGYAMSMALNQWRYGGVQADMITWVVGHFTGWAYYRMWPFKDDVLSRVINTLNKVVEDLPAPYENVHRLLKEAGMVRLR